MHGLFAYFCPPKIIHPYLSLFAPPRLVPSHTMLLPVLVKKAAEWENALHVVMEVQKIFKIGTIITYGSGISACEKSLEWQRSLQLLKELPEKSLEGILGKTLSVSAQWLGNMWVITNFCPQIWTLEMDLGWFVHDFSMRFKGHQM